VCISVFSLWIVEVYPYIEMRITPRKVLWIVVVSAFLFTVKDDVIALLQGDPFGHATLVVPPEASPDVPLVQVAQREVIPVNDAVGGNDLPAEPMSPEEQEIHDWETMQTNRKGVLNQICKEVREHADVEFPTPDLLFKYMAVDHVHKVIHCPYQGKSNTNNYKKALSWAASSSLRIKQKSENYLGDVKEAPPPSFLHDLADALNANKSNEATGNASLAVTAEDLEFGHNYTQEQMDYMLKHYVKVVFPDHPYERLLAVFDHKFTNRSDDIGITLGRTIVRMSRPGAKWKEVTDSPIYFQEYMNFVLKKKGTISDFMIYYDMCHVCDMPWDYIGKTTTYERDATHIVKAVEGEQAITHNATAADLIQLDEQEIHDHMETNYMNITEYEMLRLYDDFSLDMYLFDFQWPFYNLTLMREDPTKDGKYA
ncbi:hypothetical protein LSH36_794g01042, partial [Paralvinella palmiformis]